MIPSSKYKWIKDRLTDRIIKCKDQEGNFSQERVNEKDFTILFQDDAITDGTRTRKEDWNHIT